MTRQDFDGLIRQITDDIAGLAFDDALRARLNDRFPADGSVFNDIERACRDGVAAGWLCDRQGKKGINYSRPFKPGPETAGLSVDAVRMGSMKTPRHCHPTGEIDMLMPITPTATFDGHGRGWAVYGPGSIHEPPVEGGDIMILYFLPAAKSNFWIREYGDAWDMTQRQDQDYLGQGLWNGDTLRSLLDGLVADRPDAPAIIGPEETLSFAQLDQRSREFAAGLRRLGIGKGDVVSIQLPNLPEFLITYLAVTSFGGVLSTIHMPYGPKEAEDLLRHANARAVVCLGRLGDRSPAEAYLPFCGTLPSLDHVISVGEAPEGTVPFGDLLIEPAGDPPAPPSATDPYLMLFTSGTSASPKCILANYQWFLSNARLNQTEKKLGPDSVMMSGPPYSHLLGLYTFHLTLYAGCANLLLPVFSPPALIETITRGRPTHVFTAPAHVAACEQAGLLDRDALSSIEYAIISGAMAAPEIYRGFESYLTHGKVGQLWGMTECQCGMFTRPDDGIDRAAAFCGRPSVGTEARIVGSEGQVLDAGEEGELQIRGLRGIRPVSRQ